MFAAQTIASSPALRRDVTAVLRGARVFALDLLSRQDSAAPGGRAMDIEEEAAVRRSCDSFTAALELDPKAAGRDAERTLRGALLAAWTLHEDYDLEDERALAVQRAVETMDTSTTLFMRNQVPGREHLRESVGVGRAFADVTVSEVADEWLGRLIRLKVACSTPEGSGSAFAAMWAKDALVFKRAICSASSGAVPGNSLEATSLAAEMARRLAEHLMRADDLDTAIASLKPLVRPIATRVAARQATVPFEIVPVPDSRPEELLQRERMRA
jgi:hypothetical protein